MKTISYAITVCNEHEELDRLLTQLVKYKRPEDEIVVQMDVLQNDITTLPEDKKKVLGYIMNLQEQGYIRVILHSLNNDFALFKNNSKKNTKKDYYFCLDADEYLTDTLMLNLGDVLELNPEVDIYAVPRINTVLGLTDEDINRWGWTVNEKGWVNYPDMQTRICKNTSSIYWAGKVHERLTSDTGAYVMMLPEGFELIHTKDIERQRKQNNFYKTL
jgi:hypothetical protein